MTASLGTPRIPQSIAVTLVALCCLAQPALAEDSAGFLLPASPATPQLNLALDSDSGLAVTVIDDSRPPLSAPPAGDYRMRLLNAADGGVQMLTLDPMAGDATSSDASSARFVSIPVSADPAAQRIEISFDDELSGFVVADANVVWVSSLDGVIGIGESITINPATLSEGVHVMRLEGRNSSGLNSTATTRVQTRQVVSSQQPVAMAGDDRVVSTLSLVTLDGTGSFDPDEERIEYDWRQVAGPPVMLSDSSNVQPTFRAPSVSTDTTLTFELFVFDDTLLSQPDQVNIVVTSGGAGGAPTQSLVPSAPTGQAPQGGGGGGSFGLLALVLAAFRLVRVARVPGHGRRRRSS